MKEPFHLRRMKVEELFPKVPNYQDRTCEEFFLAWIPTLVFSLNTTG